LARKSGLDIAISDFVFHLDSDDWIEADALDLLYKKQKETDAEVVIGNFREICSWGIKNRSFVPIKNGENPIEWLLLCEHKFLWGKLYRKTIYNNYNVPDSGIFEDIIVNAQLFSKLNYNQIQFVNTFIYNYNSQISSSSLIKQLRTKKYNSYTEHPTVIAYLKVYEYLKNAACENDNIYSAYIYSFLDDAGVPYYLRGNIRIHKNELYYLYANFYKKCFHVHLMGGHRRIFLPLCNFSIVFGRVYIFIYSTVLKMRTLFYRDRMI